MLGSFLSLFFLVDVNTGSLWYYRMSLFTDLGDLLDDSGQINPLKE